MHIREVGSTVEVRPLDPEVGQPLEESEPQKANTVRNETDVITEQPRYQVGDVSMSDFVWRPWLNQKDHGIEEQQIFDDYFRRPAGLAPLAASDLISISAKSRSWTCDCDVSYTIKDCSLGTPTTMFTALEELQCCTIGSLQNIVIRDVAQQPVARCCYKEKSLLLGQLVLAVYAPPDLLIGTGEETSHYGCWCSPHFHLRNSDGELVFSVEFNRQNCYDTGKFTVETLDGNRNVVKILGRENNEIWLRFNSKLSVTLKIILLGFCINMLHRSYKQALSTKDNLG